MRARVGHPHPNRKRVIIDESVPGPPAFSLNVLTMQQLEPNVSIRSFDRTSELDQVVEIAQSLPEWFTPGGMRLIRADLRFQNGFVAVKERKLIGFVSFFVNQGKAEIGWMGVHPECHRCGIGRKLLARLTQELRAAQVREVFVHTLGDAVEYEPYRKTRAFYTSMGFKEFKRISQPENPECEEDLILVLNLDDLRVQS